MVWLPAACVCLRPVLSLQCPVPPATRRHRRTHLLDHRMHLPSQQPLLLLYIVHLSLFLRFTFGQPLAVGYIVGIGHANVPLHPVTLAVRKTTTITEVSHGPASTASRVSHHETTHALVIVPHSPPTATRFRHPVGGFGVGITIGGHGAGHGYYAVNNF